MQTAKGYVVKAPIVYQANFSSVGLINGCVWLQESIFVQRINCALRFFEFINKLSHSS